MSEMVYKYRNSRLGKVQERMKLAKLSGKPIIFLQTTEMDFIDELVKSASIIANKPSYTDYDNNNQYYESSVLFALPQLNLENCGISDSNFKQPTLFLIFADETEKGQRNSTNTKDLNEKLFYFISLYKGIMLKRMEGYPSVSPNVLESIVLVVTAEMPTVPANIALYSEYLRVPLMEREEQDEFISLTMKRLDSHTKLEKGINGYEFLEDKEYLNLLSENLHGLYKTKIVQILTQVYIKWGIHWENAGMKKEKFQEEIIKVIQDEKEQLIATSSILKLVKPSKKKAVGLGVLEEYLSDKENIVKNLVKYKRERMLDAPKGVLVSGIPGSGKSLMAKYTAQLLSIPLVRMDMGDVQNMYVGESERRMEEALEQVNAMSPCVLWVDEIEKSLAGSNGSNSDVTKRLFGKFLTWMQEKEDKNVCCFVFATANDISTLPPELFRSGRFDAKFYTFMPTAEECGEIFASLIEKQCNDYNDEHKENRIEQKLFDLSVIGKELFKGYLNQVGLCLGKEPEREDKGVNRDNKFFSGADIENVIKYAKEKYLKKNNSVDGKFVYETDAFKECLKGAIIEIRTYGETDLEKIAYCYASMTHNNFTSAAKGVYNETKKDIQVIPFDGYKEYNMDNNNLLYNLDYEKDHWSRLCKYDRSLYCMVRNVLNGQREIIIQKQNRE